MHLSHRISVLACVSLLLWSSTSLAQSTYRCNSGLVSLGDNRSSVLQKCGEPESRHSHCRALTTSATTDATSVNVQTCVEIEEWTYNPGSGRLMTTLEFEAGRLSEIATGQRVR